MTGDNEDHPLGVKGAQILHFKRARIHNHRPKLEYFLAMQIFLGQSQPLALHD